MTAAPLLAARAVSRRYPGVRALDRVDFELAPGEIHALAGQNGAGKSTLVRILGGVERPDEGRLLAEGREIAPRSPLEALRAGVAVLHQETHLVPQLSVAENFFLGREVPRRAFPFGLDWPAMRSRARERLRELGLELDVDRAAGELPAALAQVVGIARAIDLQARALVLDEPTSSLDRGEVERLFALLRRLRDQGLGIVFIAHSLEQVYAVADRISVLRDGRGLGTFPARELPRERLVALMLGRKAAQLPGRGEAVAGAAAGPPLLEARGLARRGAIDPFDLALGRGEVVGLAGLLGSGRSDLARLLGGADRATAGTLSVDGVERRLRSPRRALALGIALCPEDRKLEGVFPGLTLRENVAIVAQRRLSRFGLLSRREHEGVARRFMASLGIVASGPDQTMGTLSGGNQQKALLARALAAQPRLLVLDEPTRGVDVGAKVEIERLVEEMARRGMAVVFVSSALEEVLRRARRVLVLRDRRVVARLEGDEAREERVMELLSHSAGSDAGEP